MRRFTKVKSYAAVMNDINIDTDIIIPKQFLKTIERSGLGKNLFYDKRYFKGYQENPNFILNNSFWKKSEILIVGDNFGCGSSREHAPWALLDFGIKCIISTSFADIFFNNATKNGLFLCRLKDDQVKRLARLASSKEEVLVDLLEEKVTCSNETFNFSVEENIKERLTKGIDDIELTLKFEKNINAYEKKIKREAQWKGI